MAELDIQMATESEQPAIDAFACSHPHGQVEHTWSGCQLLPIASGGRWRSGICVARQAGRLAATMPVAIAQVASLPLRVCRSDAGPLVAPDAGGEVAAAMIEWLVRHARQHRCCRVELRMPFAQTVGGLEQPAQAGALAMLAEMDFVRRPPPYKGTYWVKLGPEDQLLEQLPSKCRRDVRKGIREGVSVQLESGPDAVEQFRRDYLQMCSRKSLPAQSEEFFSAGVRKCVLAGVAAVFSARYKGAVCNQALVTTTGQPAYWLGASGEGALTKGTPPTGQTLHYGIMRHLWGLGRQVYDLGGSPGPLPQEGHPNYGVWKFKNEFGGEFVTYLDYFDRVLAPLSNALLRCAQKAMGRG